MKNGMKSFGRGEGGFFLDLMFFIGNSFLCRVLTALILFLFASACEAIHKEEGEGRLLLRFRAASYLQTKAVSILPDTCDFILKVTGPEGNIVYEGKYGDAPERLMVNSGTYTISVRSAEFTKPQFSFPVFGDDQCVLVPPGGTGTAELKCGQMNCGIKLKLSPDFLTSYPKGVLFVKSADGKLMYGYSEKRTAYFNPGEISVLLEQEGVSRLLFTKNLKSREILSMSIAAPDKGGTGNKNAISISLDTSRIWTSGSYVIGEENQGKGESRENAYSVAEAKILAGVSQKWVYGYIVGVFKSAGKPVFSPPFPSSTNLALAGRRNVSDKNSCFSAELRKKELRSALNLVDNPSNFKRKIYLKGDFVEAYYGSPGIKNVTEYFIE